MDEEVSKDHKVIRIKDIVEPDDQLSPRGVLEIPVSSILSSRASSFNEISTPLSTDADSTDSTESGGDDEDERSEGLISPSSKAKVVRTKKFLNFKWKSLRMLSGLALVAGYEVSRKSLIKRLGMYRSNEETVGSEDSMVSKPSWRNFTLEELAAATDSFSDDNLVGRGGHAEVYKGCLPDGQLVAVKKITKKEKSYEDRAGEFLSELGIIAHINHPNAARLIGFNSDTDLHLVLEYAPHGSLATLLHNSKESFEWAIRFKVAIGIAEGLQYLHCECPRRIIHRDITASNILLMENYQPQISDFGLAKWLPEKWAQHIVFPVEGTFGYMAPEYFMHGIVHEKIDVFSFGVLLLELITGRRAVDSSRQSLVIWAKPLLEQSNIKELVDPRLENVYEITELNCAISAALACIHHLPNMRPNIKQVMQILKGERLKTELKQKTGGRAVLLDACDLDNYTATTYLKDLNRHMELAMQ